MSPVRGIFFLLSLILSTLFHGAERSYQFHVMVLLSLIKEKLVFITLRRSITCNLLIKILVLLSASVKRFGVSRVRDIFLLSLILSTLFYGAERSYQFHVMVLLSVIKEKLVFITTLPAGKDFPFA